MNLKETKELMELFFHAPAANGILVFDENDYFGVLFKRDIELGLMEQNFDLESNINFIRVSQLSDVLYKNDAKNIKIPVIDRLGKLIRIISLDEFHCHFEFNHYLPHFKPSFVLDEMDHAMVVTSHFRKVIYTNKTALELFQEDLLGKPLNSYLKKFEMKILGKTMHLYLKNKSYQLIISHSVSRNFSYNLFQFIPII